MTRAELVFLGACTLVDGKDNLYRRDSIAREAMERAVGVSMMLLDITEKQLALVDARLKPEIERCGDHS